MISGCAESWTLSDRPYGERRPPRLTAEINTRLDAVYDDSHDRAACVYEVFFVALWFRFQFASFYSRDLLCAM